jgi:DNA-binding winged helix-turn-helix (wHTH) protein
MRFEFDVCVLDTGTRQLLREGREIAISPKAFQLLEFLIRRRPEAVSKEEVQKALWPGINVSEANLASLMSEVRQAIADSARGPRFIRTLHGFGYAFAGELRERADRRPASGEGHLCRLAVRGERDYLFGAGEIVIGRDEDADVPIGSLSVSRRHAIVHVSPEGAELEDLGSKNGTSVNGRRVSRARLATGDVIRVGSVVISFEFLSGRLTTETGVVLTEVIKEARRATPLPARARQSRKIKPAFTRRLPARKRR